MVEILSAIFFKLLDGKNLTLPVLCIFTQSIVVPYVISPYLGVASMSFLSCKHRLDMFKLLVPCFSGIFKSELQAIISACRKTRSFIDQVCYKLINQAVVVMDVSSLLTAFTFRYL